MRCRDGRIRVSPDRLRHPRRHGDRRWRRCDVEGVPGGESVDLATDALSVMRITLRKLRSDKRGAVLAEHVIAIVPILMTFFTFVQLSKVATARLVVKHSAI